MSSTNRSNARKNHIADYYVTPVKDIELFLKEFNKRIFVNWGSIKVADVCAGGNPKTEYDAEHPMSYPTAIKNICNCEVDTYDIREDSFAEHKVDYLSYKMNYEPDIIITNPPFNLATQIIEKALLDVKEDGYVIMLLRLNFFGSKEREKFFEKYLPEWCFVHHIRLGFQDKKDENGYTVFDSKTGLPKRGSTDSIEYCHMVFRKGFKPEYTKLVMI